MKKEKRYSIVLDRLFSEAKKKDEFEYACTLLRIRGAESAGWDTLKETEALFSDLVTLINAPFLLATRLRLALLLYCHLVEVKEIYRIIENLLRVIEGKRASITPFWDLYGNKKRITNRKPPSAKQIIDYIKEHALKLGMRDLVDLFDEFFSNSIRNAFFHSDYVLYRDEFRSKESWFPEKISPSAINYSQSIKINRVVEMINNCILFFQTFMRVYYEHRYSYKQNKLVKARMGPNDSLIDIKLLASKKLGLYGFRTPKADHSVK